MSWGLVYIKEANKDAKKIKAANLQQKTGELLALLAKDSPATPPRFEKLVGNLNRAYSGRLNINIDWSIRFCRPKEPSKSCKCESILSSRRCPPRFLPRYFPAIFLQFFWPVLTIF